MANGIDISCPSDWMADVAHFFSERRALLIERPLFCALSGGADSVALACLMQELGLTFTALHCNFHLRGEESERDETFVRAFCEAHKIPLLVRHFNTRSEAEKHGESIEMAARRLRYAWFEEQNGWVCVAHHQDDRAETLLLNLVRGSGLRGLAAMRDDNGKGIWRPLLSVSRNSLLEYLEALGQPYVQDSSNTDTRFRRNFLRCELIPTLRKINPSVSSTLASTAERLQEALALYQCGLETMSERLPVRTEGHKRIFPLSQALQYEAAGQAWLFEQLSPLGFDAATLHRMFTAREGALFLSTSHRACLHRGTIEVMANRLPQLPQWSVRYYARPQSFSPSRNRHCVTLDADRLSGDLVLRRVAEGDRFSPFGMPKGSKTVSDYLTARHRSRLDKMCASVVCDEKGILWLVGETIDRRAAVSDLTRHICEITVVIKL